MVVELEVEETRKPEIQKMEFVWMNGKTIAWEDGNIPLMTHALHYGTGVFEGIRGYGNGANLYIFRLQDHFQRLISSARVCDIETKYSADELVDACLSLIRSNDLREDCYIRPIIFVGFSGINLGFIDYPTNAAIIVFPFKHYFSKPGLDVCISSWTRLYDPVTPPLAKICGNYVNSVFAKREAAKNGYDEALMLNSQGKVSEGTGENIFVVKKGKMYTPSMGASILDGITRNTIIELAKEFQIDVLERDVARSELYTADEVFLTGTAAGIAPVLTVDRRLVGDGKVGPITKSLLQGYSEVVLGKNTLGHEDWVTKVY
ncbi:MAG: branched-chain amino acid transaminase [Nitrososphaerales archaeon]|jgi:branched-chain amino acid aminotransferase